jgi:hypothetical protein
LKPLHTVHRRRRRPRAPPLSQIVHHCWSDFPVGYGRRHRPIHGRLRHDAIDVVRPFRRCGGVAACPEPRTSDSGRVPRDLKKDAIGTQGEREWRPGDCMGTESWNDLRISKTEIALT